MVHVPTTTVAAMDSVLSLKQAVNSVHGKNHLGVYHRPEAVLTDISLLRTLPERELRSGLCETLKNCLAIRPGVLDNMRGVLSSGIPPSDDNLLWLLDESIRAKIAVMGGDTKEQWSGIVLEYGHTAGHAVELCDLRLRGEYGVSHGAAIAFGMRIAARLAADLGGLDQAELALHDELIDLVGAPSHLPSGVTVPEVLSVIGADNKRGYLDLGPDEAAFVLLDGLGRPMVTDRLPLVPVPLDLVETVLAGFVAEPADDGAIACPVPEPERLPGPRWDEGAEAVRFDAYAGR
jgi:3-dehydroquinate synthase/2-deoxy-scyllo-inosose synthase